MGQRSKISTFAFLFLILFGLTVSTQVEAKTFRNSYLRFQLPEKWSCKLKGTVYSCRYSVPPKCKGVQARSKNCQKSLKKYREAIIHLTAKETGPKDSLKLYMTYLKTPKIAISKDKRRVKSKVIHLKKPKISGLAWVDGMHLGSELPSYYTRYLATVKGNVAVLVTFSSHKNFYSKYSSQFFQTIKTLKVYSAAKKNPRLAKKDRPNINPNPMDPLTPIRLEDDIEGEDDGTDGSAGGTITRRHYILGGLGLGLMAILFLFFWVKKP